MITRGIPLEKIEYGFDKDELASIRVTTRGKDNFEKLGRMFIELYGNKRNPPAKVQAVFDAYNGKRYTETLGIYYQAIRHEDTNELEHNWNWCVPNSGDCWVNLAIIFNTQTQEVRLEVRYAVAT